MAAAEDADEIAVVEHVLYIDQFKPIFIVRMSLKARRVSFT